MHIWLIGMMGTGKTTVGAVIAERLALPLVDTDAEVMAATGKTIPELFAESEETFRRAESAIITELVTAPRSVISTGGGAILDATNTEAMHGSGTVILLEAPLDDLAERITPHEDRPLVGHRDDIARIARERSDSYEAAADHRVGTGGRSPNEVAEEVLACLST